MKQPLPQTPPLKNKRSLMSRLWSLRHGPLNLLKIIEMMIELPLAVPHCLLCAIADSLSDKKRQTPPDLEGSQIENEKLL